VLHLAKALERSSANTLSRRLRRDEFGKFFLEIPEFTVQFIILLIANTRSGLQIVPAIMFGDFYPQFLYSTLGFFESFHGKGLYGLE
jgi:hypothetical protein